MSDDELSEEELAADRAAILRFRQQIAHDLRDAKKRGRVATRIEWRGYLRKTIARERALRAELDAARQRAHDLANEIAIWKAWVMALEDELQLEIKRRHD